MKRTFFILNLLAVIALTGCFSGGSSRGNIGQFQVYPVPKEEAEWIRSGEPIVFEGGVWYPMDGIEILLDSEVGLVGEYEGVQFFVDRIDIKPYDRLYTKFGVNKFRVFEKREISD